MRDFPQLRSRMFVTATLAALGVLLLCAPGALAETFTVTKTQDTADGSCDADCSLREAIIAANANEKANTIMLPAGIYTLTRTGPGEEAAATGDLDITEGALEIVGAGARTTVIRGDGSDRIFDVKSSGAVTISGVTIEGGRGVEQGAGIDVSGGIPAFTLRDAAVLDNQTTAPETVTSRQGAGLFLGSNASTIERVLISGNVANSIAGDGFGPQGAGVFINGVTTLTNDTITGNTADGKAGGGSPPQGGGIFVNETTTMSNVTLSDNAVTDTGVAEGGGIFFNSPTTMSHTIIAGNTAKGSPNQCVNNSEPIASIDGNLSTDTLACGLTQPGDVSADPLLTALANNGGPTDTQALASGSPALDRVPFANCPALDQRGFARAGAGSGCDFGAFESGAPAAATPSPTPPLPPAPTLLPPTRQPPLPPATATVPLIERIVLGLPSAKKCLSKRAFTLHLFPVAGVHVTSGSVFVNGHRVAVRKGKLLSAPVNLRGLPKGRYTVKVVVRLADGRTLTESRRFRTCVPGRHRRGRR